MNAITTSQEYRALMMFDRLPAGCISFMCTDDYSAPHIRPGEFVVVDTSDRQPRHLELYVIQWENGRRVICQARDTGRKTIEQPEESAWSIGSLRAIRGRAARNISIRNLPRLTLLAPSPRYAASAGRMAGSRRPACPGSSSAA
jgi:hypothetical protein